MEHAGSCSLTESYQLPDKPSGQERSWHLGFRTTGSGTWCHTAHRVDAVDIWLEANTRDLANSCSSVR